MPIVQTVQSKVLSRYDDFESYSTGAWSGANIYTLSSNSTDTILAGQYLRSSALTPSVGHQTNVMINGFDAVNGKISALVRCTGVTNDERARLFLRVNLGVEDVSINLFYTGSTSLAVTERVSGVPTVIDDVGFAGSAGTWYYLEGEVIGGTINAKIMDSTQTTTLASTSVATSTTINGGASFVLVSNDGGAVDIDDFAVKAL